MTPLVRAFKRMAHQVAQQSGLRMSDFIHERGLGDFLLEHENSADVVDLVGQAILHFCVDEGGYNGFETGVMLCVGFLDEFLRTPPAGTVRAQALKDLFVLINTKPSVESVKRWIETYYC